MSINKVFLLGPAMQLVADCSSQPVSLLRSKLGLVYVCLLFLVLLACGADPITWSATSQSPDGGWIALAHTVQHGGFGTSGVETIVEIKQGQRNASTILGF